MLTVHLHITENIPTKPMECPNCGFKRLFDVPKDTCVRKARRGLPPIFLGVDFAILKCKKCGHGIGVSIE